MVVMTALILWVYLAVFSHVFHLTCITHTHTGHVRGELLGNRSSYHVLHAGL